MGTQGLSHTDEGLDLMTNIALISNLVQYGAQGMTKIDMIIAQSN